MKPMYRLQFAVGDRPTVETVWVALPNGLYHMGHDMDPPTRAFVYARVDGIPRWGFFPDTPGIPRECWWCETPQAAMAIGREVAVERLRKAQIARDSAELDLAYLETLISAGRDL